MLDLKLIRENPTLIKQNSKNREYDSSSVDKILKFDEKWRSLKNEDDKLRHERNLVSEEINKAKKAKKDVKPIIAKAKSMSDKLLKNEEEEKSLRKEIDSLLSMLPNIQAKDVPIGGEDKNKEILKWGILPEIKNPKTHFELGEELDILDIKRATKLSGSGFYLLKGMGARLQRALVQFMLDFHIKNGFVEINPPQLVNKETAFGTGNLPKFKDDLYWVNDEFVLIPTAEVPVTNIYAGEILLEKDLPKKFCAFTQCYRTEAGRRSCEEGLFRLHQFEKVEMVYLCKPEQSWKFLKEMTNYSETILKKLKIPYRKILLATADAGFASAKTYDLEVWSPSRKKYLEASSCSNCLDFQARRMNTRYQDKDEIKFVHTLNGSGLALPRLMISIIENYQMNDGSIKIPTVLQKYMGDIKKIENKKKNGNK